MDIEDGVIAQTLFNHLVEASMPESVMGLFRGSVPILMWYQQGDIQLATYADDDGGTVTGEDISPESAVDFLAPEGTVTEQIVRVATILGGIIQSDLAANGVLYQEEAAAVRSRIFPLPLSERDREIITTMMNVQGVALFEV